MTWALEATEKVASLWKAGFSITLIGEQLEKTRNAVIGKLHRMGLKDSDRPPEVRVRKKPAIKAARVVKVKPKLAFVPIPDDPELITDPDRIHPFDAAIPMKQRRQTWELTSKTCKFPVGRPGHVDFFHCGAVPLQGYIYCEFHCQRTYKPPEPIYFEGLR